MFYMLMNLIIICIHMYRHIILLLFYSRILWISIVWSRSPYTYKMFLHIHRKWKNTLTLTRFIWKLSIPHALLILRSKLKVGVEHNTSYLYLCIHYTYTTLLQPYTGIHKYNIIIIYKDKRKQNVYICYMLYLNCICFKCPACILVYNSQRSV